MVDRPLGPLLSDLHELSTAFDLGPGRFSYAFFGSGHINDTVLLQSDDRPSAFVAQKINVQVFEDPDGLMANIALATDHIRSKLLGLGWPDRDRRALTLLRARNGSWSHRTDAGSVWRLYHHIGNTFSVDEPETPRQAFEAAKAFAWFQQQLLDIDSHSIVPTIPYFHHGPTRYRRFVEVLGRANKERADAAAESIAFVLQRENLLFELEQKQASQELPIRITHNDTKINNVLLDRVTGESLCVVDLDTVMPGLVAYDFGDLVRTASCLAAEDERDLSLLRVEAPLYESLVRGYLTYARSFLTEPERDSLAWSGGMMTFLIGLRFLTDFLDGDRYFKIHRPRHNLERARAQFALVRSIEKALPWMQDCVRTVWDAQERI
ncbi:MAG TPA: phosphotransferase [Planctomycetota bacterium]|nr:phosphotransferase [Planctomycetota bacterium]